MRVSYFSCRTSKNRTNVSYDVSVLKYLRGKFSITNIPLSKLFIIAWSSYLIYPACNALSIRSFIFKVNEECILQKNKISAKNTLTIIFALQLQYYCTKDYLFREIEQVVNRILDVYIIYVTLLQCNVYHSAILQNKILLYLSNRTLLYINKTV